MAGPNNLRNYQVSQAIRLESVSKDEQIKQVVELASIIWTEHYTPIIGSAQVAYMLKNIQSFDAIKNELKNPSVRYFLIVHKAETIGYIGIKLEKTQLFLSKIYILSSARGLGAGKKALDLVKEIALSEKLGQIYLTVNKYNTGTIAAYQKLGFEIIEELCADIGEGFVMDDYKMRLPL